MQDSIEDYIKIAGVQKGFVKTTLDNAKLNSIRATLEYKKRAEEYAQRVVEFLIEGKLRPQIFLRSLNCINEALYEDVIDERSITKLCGYPVCGNTIPDMPEKKYIILAKVNKVFDLTERKKYCSNFCYKASIHIKSQIDNSPLWLRKPENAPEYNLLAQTNTGLSPGEEVVNGVQPPADESTFTSVTAFTEACLDEAEDNLPDDDLDKQGNFTPSEGVNVGKSILKQGSTDNQNLKDIDLENNSEELRSSTSKDIKNANKKKVQFMDNIEMPSSTEEIKLKEREELNKSIQNICRSMNINLNLTPSEDSSRKVENKSEEIHIDHDKMNRAIEKVNEAEKQRKKQPVLIDTKINPELHTKHFILGNKIKTLEPPKYTQRIKEIYSHKKPVNNDVEIVIEKVKNLELNKKQLLGKEQDEKMKKILEKIKNKNIAEKKGVIMVDTIENPEVHRAQVEEVVKASASPSKSLETNEYKKILDTFSTWLTFETFLFIHGEEKVREIVNSEKVDSYFNKLKVTELEVSQQMKYLEICKRLQLKELREEKFDSGCSSDHQEVLKPIPDYDTLKQEVDEINLKAQAFYSGKIVVRTKENSEKGNADNEAVLPLVDASNAIAMRRNVFNKSALQYIKNHLSEISAPDTTICKVQELIKSFKFDAKTIVFRPAEWNIIALILINCLRSMDKNLQTEEATKYFDECSSKLTNLKKLFEETNSMLSNFDIISQNHIIGSS